jgi:AraC-like DNA-binding protein
MRHNDATATTKPDSISDVLKSVRMNGALFFESSLAAPWCLHGRYGLADVRQRWPAPDHLVQCHFVVAGRCLVRLIDSAETFEAQAGDLLLFAHDEMHLIGSDLAQAPMAADHRGEDLPPATTAVDAMLVSGYFTCDAHPFRSLFAALPRLLRVPLGDAAATSPWRPLFAAGARITKSATPGAASTLAKMAELVFVEALRRHVAALPQDARGWIAALCDPPIGRALGLLHQQPERPWSVTQLAREVALSRSLLAQRFSQRVGESPMQYLRGRRLALAAGALRTSRETISRIAEHSGYETEAAFSRAFKREFGRSPSAWRRDASSNSADGVRAPHPPLHGARGTHAVHGVVPSRRNGVLGQDADAVATPDRGPAPAVTPGPSRRERELA